MIEKNLCSIFKIQNTHIQNKYFELKPNHFQMLEALKKKQ